MGKSPKALIAFVTLTGNTEEIALRLEDELKKLQVETKVEDIMVISAADFSDYDICVVASYSFDSGDETVPDEAMEFFEELGGMDLSGKVYGVLGSGQNDIYEHFCGSVDRFDEQFRKTKAIRGGEPLKFDWDISTVEDEKDLTDFAHSLVNALSLTLQS